MITAAKLVLPGLSGLALASIMALPPAKNLPSPSAHQIPQDQLEISMLVGSNYASVGTNFWPAKGQTARGQPLTTNSTALAPGLYQSQPYTCLIAVPQPSGDNCCVASGIYGFRSWMPVSKPEIQFTPWPPR